MNDIEFTLYCELHCRTDRALFEREQVVRIVRLAGQHIDGARLPEWIVVRPGIMDALVRDARARLKDPVLRALADAPLDDEELTPDEEARVAEGRAAVARGETMSTEELTRRLDLDS